MQPWDCQGRPYFEQSSWSKGISETNSKLENPCSKCMQQPCDITGRENQNKQNYPYHKKKKLTTGFESNFVKF